MTQKRKKILPKILKILIKIYLILAGIIVTLVLLYLFLARHYRPFQVNSGGMSPEYPHKAMVFAKTFKPDAMQINRRDVIVYKKIIPDSRSTKAQYIDRVVGVPGDLVEVTDGDVFVNKQLIRDGYDYDIQDDKSPLEGVKLRITDGYYFILPDQGIMTSDVSKAENVVKEKNIIGVVKFCYYNCEPK